MKRNFPQHSQGRAPHSLHPRSALPSAPPTDAPAPGAAGQFNMEGKNPSSPARQPRNPAGCSPVSTAKGRRESPFPEGKPLRLPEAARAPLTRPRAREGAGPGGRGRIRTGRRGSGGHGGAAAARPGAPGHHPARQRGARRRVLL